MTDSLTEPDNLSASLVDAVEALNAIVEEPDRSLDAASWKLEQVERIVPALRRQVHAILAEAVC